MTTVEQQICDAIDIIVEKAISEASYDKTVQATIVCCVDATIGKYKVSYQDSTFYAYSGSSEITYPDGTSVYVLIPGNDFSQDKTILGTTKKLGINYVVTTEGDEAYEYTGVNIVDASTNVFTLCSYKEGTQVDVLYSKEYSDSLNKITIDKTAMQEYIKSSSSIVCGAEIRTALPLEQQLRGNYGIIFALDFDDNTGNEVVTRYYTVDVDKMVGNPYKLVYSTRQYGIFDIDGENFREVNYISLFCYDFPNSLPDEQCIDDIFISNIELTGANRLSDDDISNYSLTFVTPQGTYFTSSNLDSDTITLQAEVRVKGKVVDNDSQELPFYWGSEHVGVTSQSQYYNKYLGQGWKCLNDYNMVQGTDGQDDAVVEWVPASYQFVISKSDVIAQEVEYKCAVVYDGTVITKTITVKNIGSSWNIYINSDSGTQFYYDIGYPTLTCCIERDGQLVSDYDNFTFSWAVTNNVGNFSTFSETSDLNNDYNSLLEQYNEAVADTLHAAARADEIAELEQLLAVYDKVTRVEDNTIYHINVNTITSFSTYQCTVFYDGLYLGTASIVLLNTYDTEGTYSLIINDGSYVYKYNENGVSPASSAVDSPIDIKALTFTIYDNLGQAIEDDVARHCDIKWIVPTANTLIEIPSSYSPSAIDLLNNTATYSGLMSFSYQIASKYDVTKSNNDIYLIVDYKDTSLSAKTDLTFLKEGESGTNGTGFTCRIVPNVSSGEVPKYLIATINSSNVVSYNYNPAQTGLYLKVQLWHNEEEIFSDVVSGNSLENKSVSVVWSVLKNSYNSLTSDPTVLNINAATGVFSCSGYSSNSPANIIKATVVYDGVTYYATFPVITIKMSSALYEIALKKDTGFQYATYTSDGRSPKYDNVNPFEITTLRLINSYWEDVSTTTESNYAMTYSWNYLGQIYENKTWVSATCLENRNVSGLASNQKAVKPADAYDGQCVTNAVECIVKNAGTEVGRIHIPVHLMLNRYGLSYLNSWDGNSIEINEEDGGFILAPQVGAGQKESDNSFTGVLMGAVKEGDSSTTEVGLFGYSSGARSIFLDASTGKSIFGKSGSGQIVIDPSGNTAQIYSGDYYDTNGKATGKGMLIDLNKPSIEWGNGNFSVDSDGYITAKGGGTIAGFAIDNTSLWTPSTLAVSSNSTFRISSAEFSRSLNGTSRTNLYLASSSNFGVGSDGTMYAGKGIIGSGSNKITIGQSSDASSNSAIYSGSKTAFNANASGFYIGTDGIALGAYANSHSAFEVSSSGSMVAKTGYIGNGSSGWTIGNSSLYNSKSSYTSTSSGVYIGTDGIALGAYSSSYSSSPFQVNSSGSLYSRSGQIGGWTINANTLTSTSGQMTLNGNGSISGGTTYNWSITAAGVATFNNIQATGGSIGGWTINGDSLYGSGIYLYSTGSIRASNGLWSITSGGQATFQNIYVTGGTINLGGTIMNSGAGYTQTDAGSFRVTGSSLVSGTNELDTYVQDIANLRVQNLIVTGNFSVGGHTTKWDDVRVVSRVEQTWNSITDLSYIESITPTRNSDGAITALDITRHSYNYVTRNLSATIYYKYIYIMTYEGTEFT